MPNATNIVSLHRRHPARPSFLHVHVVPLWQRVAGAMAIVGEVWREARALERSMVPRRFSDR